MDFIKTSSLRALIELTFQRNWNGLIWMSRKGVTTKRVKTVQTALSRNSAQPRSPAGRGTMFRARPKLSVRLKSRPKSKPLGRSRITTRETSPRSATPQPPRHSRARPKRASRESLAAAQLAQYRARTLRPTGRTPRVRPRISSAKLIRRPRRPTVNPSGPTVPTRPQPDCPADRPARPSQRRGRPEALLKPNFIFSSPA
ncbi:unnamed protein product [Microthlaspi erraticum]|uniref:Uncharacterized protein n=1 Tax=Microthlaspi erraticum TaxID=1685480 RepID=A0A6D2JY71_9BRAS|nr:unnamed protein product [Microthlaspi erraticum]